MVSKGSFIRIQVRSDGYNKVSMIDESKGIYESGRFVSCFLHRLICMMFLPNPYNLPEVNHIDRNKSNCRVENLEWCTHRDNIIHSFKTRIVPTGNNHWRFGSKAKESTKKIMSEQKLGENHPKFKAIIYNFTQND